MSLWSQCLLSSVLSAFSYHRQPFCKLSACCLVLYWDFRKRLWIHTMSHSGKEIVKKAPFSNGNCFLQIRILNFRLLLIPFKKMIKKDDHRLLLRQNFKSRQRINSQDCFRWQRRKFWFLLFVSRSLGWKKGRLTIFFKSKHNFDRLSSFEEFWSSFPVFFVFI